MPAPPGRGAPGRPRGGGARIRWASAAVEDLAACAQQGKDPHFLGLVSWCRAQLEPSPELAERQPSGPLPTGAPA